MDEQRTFQPGELIFKQGDIGDTMLMIKEGSVEIFKDTPQGEVLLTMQNRGEIVGMFTFFTGGQRLASARARTHVEAQVISRVSGQDPLNKLPKWVQVVIREYTLRLEQVNDQYMRTLQEKQDLQARALDTVFMSTQIADCIAELSPLKKQVFDDGREMVFVEPMLDMIEACLGYDRSLIKQVYDIFKDTGLLKIELDPDHRKEVFSLVGALRLKWYSDFVRSTRSGKNRRLLETPILYRHRRTLFQLRDFVQKSGHDVQQSFKMNMAVLSEQFARVMKTPLEPSALEAGEKLGLIEINRKGHVVTVAFHPLFLVRTLITLNVIRRLRKSSSDDADDVAS